MSTGKQTPLGINADSGQLQNSGFYINPTVVSYMGISKTNSLYTFGKMIQETCLRVLTWAIHDAFNRSAVNGSAGWQAVSNGAWGSFMNSHAIWSGTNDSSTVKNRYVTVNFASTGYYTFNMAADNRMNVMLDYERPIAIGVNTSTSTVSVTRYIYAGNHAITMIITNDSSGGPAGGALQIVNSSGSEIFSSSAGMPVAVVNGATVSSDNYDDLITIGKDLIPALGNSPPNTFVNYDPSKRWPGFATTGYFLVEDPSEEQGQSQTAHWLGWNVSNTNKSITQWGYYRLFPLQAWNEFNWNGEPLASGMPEYKDFTSSFLTADQFVNYTNVGINSFEEAPRFLKGTYSNMNDLISADVSGISLATKDFGSDLIALGRAIDLTKIQIFGMPSVLLQTIKQNKILTQSLSFALLAAGLTLNEINEIADGILTPVPKTKEQQIYGAFNIITGRDLTDILYALNCKTKGLETLADLLNIKKMLPTSYQSLTVPLYNASPGPTNSKTYYPVYNGDAVNNRIQSPEVIAQVGEIIPAGAPPVNLDPATVAGQSTSPNFSINSGGGVSTKTFWLNSLGNEQFK